MVNSGNDRMPESRTAAGKAEAPGPVNADPAAMKKPMHMRKRCCAIRCLCEICCPTNMRTSPSPAIAAMWQRHTPGLTWKWIEWVRTRSEIPIVVKGVLDPMDAELAVDHGAAAVVVSNHGARQLGSAIASIDALPDIVQAVGGKVPILLDGGVRRGTDVLKALALGATAIQIESVS